MYGREKLAIYRINGESPDAYLFKSEVDAIMDTMEQRIDDECNNNRILSNVNESLRRRLYESNGKILKLEKELRAANSRIKELEAAVKKSKDDTDGWFVQSL